jgi:hypothetical protein
MAHPNARITNSLSGAQYIGGTSPTNGEWSAIQAVTDTKFHTLTGSVIAYNK